MFQLLKSKRNTIAWRVLMAIALTLLAVVVFNSWQHQRACQYFRENHQNIFYPEYEQLTQVGEELYLYHTPYGDLKVEIEFPAGFNYEIHECR